MDSFESLIAHLFTQDGYWVRTCFKVDLTQEDKKQIERSSSPRWELDVIAYKPKDNDLRVIECKSYLDSTGVKANGFIGDNQKAKQRYKLFNEERLRDIVSKRLACQLHESGSCLESPQIRLGMAVGKFASENDKKHLKMHFAEKVWDLYDDEWFMPRLQALADSRYENEIATVVAKIIFRNCRTPLL